MARKSFQETDLVDAFLFAVTMEDEETCQMVLELILGRSVGKVRVQVERNVMFSKDFRYVRLDDKKAEGREEGSESMLELVNRMIEDGKTSEISRLKTDPAFLEEMRKKYQLQEQSV